MSCPTADNKKPSLEKSPTALMITEMFEGFPKEYYKYDETHKWYLLTLPKDEAYIIINHNIDFVLITKKHSVSIGHHPFIREACTHKIGSVKFPKFSGKYDHNCDILSLLSKLATDVRNTFNTNNIKIMNELITSWDSISISSVIDQEKSCPIIPLHKFITTNPGVCRHIAYVTSLFLASLIHNDLFPNGQVFLYRHKIPIPNQQEKLAYHAWTIYHEELTNKYYLIDSTKPHVFEINEKNRNEYLYQIYGKKAIDDMISDYHISAYWPTSDDSQSTQPIDDLPATLPMSQDDIKQSPSML